MRNVTPKGHGKLGEFEPKRDILTWRSPSSLPDRLIVQLRFNRRDAAKMCAVCIRNHKDNIAEIDVAAHSDPGFRTVLRPQQSAVRSQRLTGGAIAPPSSSKNRT